MPDESQPPSESDPLYEPTRMASSDHPSGDTWRLQQTPTRTPGSVPPGGTAPAAEVIGDFEIVGKLGQGGMGTVYRARQRSLDRLVALKILPARLETDAEYVARFQREARVAASLSHANLVRVYTSGAVAGCHYIAMELIEGETLADLLKRGPVPPLEAVRIILATTHALEYGWRIAQLIHRDIKPGNIFLSRDGAVKLGDLGLAKTSGGDTTGLTQTGAMMGTPHYISPEQARGDKELDFRADIYSLGCTLFQMLTGRTPYEGRDPFAVMNQHVNAPPPAILKIMPQLPVPLARLVSRTLKKLRRERQASYEELIAQLQSVEALLDPANMPPLEKTPNDGPVGGSTGSGGLQPPEALAKRPAGKPKLPLYGAIAASILVLGVAGYFLWPKEEKLTAAQRWAREHAGDKKGETEQSPAGGIVYPVGMATPRPAAAANNDPMPSITGWQDVMEEVKKNLPHVAKTDFTEENGWVVATAQGQSGFYVSPKSSADMAFRGKFRGAVEMFVRGAPAGKLCVIFEADGSGRITRADNKPENQTQYTQLQVFSFAAIPEHEFLITAVGVELRVWVDGKLVAAVHDAGHPSGVPGMGIHSAGAAVRDLAMADLSLNPIPATAAPAGLVNLLALVDVQRDAVAGTWTTSPEGLAVQHDGRLQFNYAPPAQYDFVVEFTVQAGDSGDVAQIVALPDRSIVWRMLPPANLGPKLDGLSPADPKRTEGLAHGVARFKPGERHRSVVEVRANSLRALLDGVEVLEFSGDLKRLTGDGGYSLHDTKHLGVAANNGLGVLFHKAEVWPIGASVGAAPVAAPGAQFSPSSEPWVDALADPAAIVLNSHAKRTADGFALGDRLYSMTLKPLKGPDYAVRMLVQVGNNSHSPWIYLRHTRGPGFNMGYYVAMSGWDHVSIGKYAEDKFSGLKTFAVKPFALGEIHELEGRIVGNKISIKLDGVEAGFVENESLREGGVTLEGQANPDEIHYVRGVQYLDLSAAVGGAGVVPGAQFSPSSEPWVDALANPAALKLIGGVKRTAEGLEWGDKSGRVDFPRLIGTDYAVRFVAQTTDKAQKSYTYLRHTGGRGYFVVFEGVNSVSVGRYEGGFNKIKTFTTARSVKPGESYELETRIVGHKITVAFDGVTLGSVEDDKLTDGGVSIDSAQIIRGVQYLDLSAPAKAGGEPDAPMPNPSGDRK